jgi:hypothetical protein
MDRHGARQVGQEDDAGLEQADEERLAARVVDRELGADLADPRTDLRGGQVDVADAGIGRGYGVSANRYRRARRSMSRR